ncbi:MAG: hypothetical protein HND47_15485 [Chloroflexi bacterium]|nr:hypothetical protein [Chloroflexota bacterium]
MKYLLGIDQGTTQTTAVIVDERGEMLEKNSSQLPARFPQAGWVEQEPEDIVRTVREACAPLLEKYDITAVGFDNRRQDLRRLGCGNGRSRDSRHRLAGYARAGDL